MNPQRFLRLVSGAMAALVPVRANLQAAVI